MATGRLIVVCGLAAETRIAIGSDKDPDVVVIAGGGDGGRLAADIEAFASGASGIISFGVAGGLSPGLRPGDVRVADLVIAPGGELFTPDPAWAASLRSKLGPDARRWNRLAKANPDAGLLDKATQGTDSGFSAYAAPRNGARKTTDPSGRDMPLARFACVDTPLADIAGKAALHRATGADLVDMESHIAARVAARHGVPFAALRAVTDPAHRSLPHAATVGMRADGKVDLAAIFRSLRGDPSQVPGLVRTGLDARAAFAALFRCRQLLGRRFASLDL